MTEKKSWTQKETELLRRLYEQGVSVHDIAEKLGRSYASVRSKAQRLGLHRRQEEAADTIQPLKPAEESLGYSEVFKLWTGLLKRFCQGPLTQDEVRFLSAATRCLAGYIRACKEFAAPPGSSEAAELNTKLSTPEESAEFLDSITELQDRLAKAARRTRQ